ncbi:double-stranded RNA-specific editase 1-like [Amphiura filiformis]|uniref:double-stranded RNA-specific editase 1-like n=1 Tax=Amphiura filiformis TaxID=82378 RepID=UPI003B224ADB
MGLFCEPFKFSHSSKAINQKIHQSESEYKGQRTLFVSHAFIGSASAGIKTKYTMANCKTPVSILQELCAKKGVTPVYDTVGQEGASHQPKFTMVCTVGSTSGRGQGPSKKAAKQAAAEEILQKLDVEVPQTDGTRIETGEADNPVGELQELVTYLGWRRPEYEEEEESGPPHDRQFTIKIKVGKFEEQGVDKSKRLAKRAAARAMLATIKALPPDTDPGLALAASAGGIPPKSKAKKSRAPANMGPPRVTLASLQASQGERISKLRTIPLNLPASNYCKMLQELAEELNFEVIYKEIEELSQSQMYQCLVKLTTSPVSVCHGVGQSRDISRADAARNALHYLKIMATTGMSCYYFVYPDPTNVIEDFVPPSRKNTVQLLNEMNGAALDFTEYKPRRGPSHNPLFFIEVTVDGNVFRGEGNSKQKAKENVSSKALRQLFGVAPPLSPGVLPKPSPAYTSWVGQEYELADQIQSSIVDCYQELVFVPGSGKTRYLKFKVLAGIVMTTGHNLESAEVVCFSTGTKCPQTVDLMEGEVLHDCHAEVVARRCLKRFLIYQLNLAKTSPGKSIFEKKNSAIIGDDKYRLRNGVGFHLYISCPPCGDAGGFIKQMTDMGERDAHPNREARGVLRAKIKLGEGTIPLTGKSQASPERLFNMSCSDKVASWNVVGIQGALLSNVMDPIYLDSIVLGSQCHYTHLPRALYGRLTDLTTLPSSYYLNKPLMIGATEPPSNDVIKISPSSRAPDFSINWTLIDQEIEVVDTTTGKTKENEASRLSKQTLFIYVKNVFPDLAVANGSKKKRSYRDLKEAAHKYQDGKVSMKRTFQQEGLGKWLKKPKMCDDFQ